MTQETKRKMSLKNRDNGGRGTSKRSRTAKEGVSGEFDSSGRQKETDGRSDASGSGFSDIQSEGSVDENVINEVLSENDSPELETDMHIPMQSTPTIKRSKCDDTNGATPTRGLLNKKLFATPVKTNGFGKDNDTPRIERNADRSARRKSTRNLIERTILGDTSENDQEEDDIAQHIYDSGEEEELNQQEVGTQSEEIPPTPSKRGRPKGSKSRKRSPTPPPGLEAHEQYFFQNRGGRAKTSNNDLSSLALLDHEEYFTRTRTIVDDHSEDIKFLEQLHAQAFNQWQFELSQDFNICFYGWGSKRSLLMQFADHVYKSQADHTKQKVVVVNGYVNNLTIRDVLNSTASAIVERGQKLGSQPSDMLENLLALLEENKGLMITLIIHSIDGIALRRPTTQTILSRLGSHPQVNLVASANHPSFPLLWDSSLRSTYNFLFHDCTTFQPYTAEVDVVDEVHELLGRSGRRVGGKEGVSFVLKSLPENAKNLFRVLIGEQLAAMEGDTLPNVGEDKEGVSPRAIGTASTEVGIEYRVLYQKAVEEFICSNEMNFRTLLKE